MNHSEPKTQNAKRKTLKRSLWIFPGYFLLHSALGLSAQAQGTAFTYQGRLGTGGIAASGTYDFRFKLYSDNQGITQVGTSFATNGIGVTNGLFTASVDFGGGIFTGQSRWLEVAVKTNGGAGYTVLTPLQAVAPAPHAVFAGSAGNLAGTLPVSQLSGTLAAAQLPASVVTNNAMGLNLSGTFSGNGAGVANVNAVSLGGIGSAGFWRTSGNAGANPTNGAFLGTTDNSPLLFKVNGSQALRLEPATNYFFGISPNVIGGSADNVVSNGLAGCVIAGGGSPSWPNRVGGEYSAVLGGMGNSASGARSTAMGDRTTASGFSSTAIGQSTTASGENSTAMGKLTSAKGDSSTALGFNTTANGFASLATGNNSIASGSASLASGETTIASGYASAAMGYLSRATNAGTFVWADLGPLTQFNSTGDNQFLIRATGGVGINTNNPQATLDVNGSVRVGSIGTVINNLQAGQAIMPGSSLAATNFTIPFPKAFTTTPKILVTVANDPAWQGVGDTFAVSVSSQSTTSFRVNVVRVDMPAAWSQQLRINWQAWQ